MNGRWSEMYIMIIKLTARTSERFMESKVYGVGRRPSTVQQRTYAVILLRHPMQIILDVKVLDLGFLEECPRSDQLRFARCDDMNQISDVPVVEDCPWSTNSSGSPDEFRSTQYVQMTGYPFLLVLCSVGNVLNIIVLSQIRPHQSVIFYLMAIALGDLITL